MGPITLDAKHAGERSAGKPPAPFDEAGAGNVTMAAGLRASAKALEQPPEPNVGAPVLDPTFGYTIVITAGQTRASITAVWLRGAARSTAANRKTL